MRQVFLHLSIVVCVVDYIVSFYPLKFEYESSLRPIRPGRNETINILMMLCDFLSLLAYMDMSFAWSPACAPNFYGFCSFLGLISIVLDKLRP